MDWDKIIPKGFHILPRRWVVERTNAWISRCRRLARDFEGLCASAEAFIMDKVKETRRSDSNPILDMVRWTEAEVEKNMSELNRPERKQIGIKEIGNIHGE